MPTRLSMNQTNPAPRDELRACDGQIARLVAQLQRDNEAITRMIEDRQQRRRELLAAQERKLRALRSADDAEAIA
jgi:hypothetical protein